MTAQVPGVHVKPSVFPEGFPVQLCGPLNVTVPSAATVPVKPLNGAAKLNEQLLCVATAESPISVVSQC